MDADDGRVGRLPRNPVSIIAVALHVINLALFDAHADEQVLHLLIALRQRFRCACVRRDGRVRRVRRVGPALLQVPHPRIAERDFVLQPLVDIQPDLKLFGRTVRELLEALPVVELEQVSEVLRPCM